MPPRYYSRQAASIDSVFLRFCKDFKEKYINSDRDKRAVLDETILNYVEELDDLLHRDAIRGQRDPRTREPEVNIDSATGKILKRMKRQMKAICILADMVHDGPPANESEDTLISRAAQMLHDIYKLIIPPSSISAVGPS
ncbi:unnamed protein product [Auanema sp. JU1783]|nr:unnamed protein product [Auanema sp. JU1783]